MNPKVTIIIPCYNAEKWIAESIQSALNQTYQNTEVIVVDNESTDSSVEIIKSIQKKNPSLICSSTPNIYPNCWDEAREEGYKLMTGEYMTVIGADDVMNSNYIENCVAIATRSPDKIKVLQSPAQGFTIKDGREILTGLLLHEYSSIKELKAELLKRCPVNSPSVFYKASLYHEGMLKTYPEKYGGAADYDLYCRLVDNGVFIYPFPNWIGFNYRWHEEQATWKVHEEGANYDEMIQDYWREKWQL
jgi:glycosyltransferase involved in cell wall biosynthesis